MLIVQRKNAYLSVVFVRLILMYCIMCNLILLVSRFRELSEMLVAMVIGHS